MAVGATLGQVDNPCEAANVAANMPPWVEKLIAAWGVTWVSLLLGRAVWRLTPIAIEPWAQGSMSMGQQALYLGWAVGNAYLEGYRAFQLKFCPRVVARAIYLGRHPKPLWVVLALPFCMSLFHSNRRQMTVSWSFIGVLILVIWWVRTIPQPWRGIIDGGVVVGLVWGIGVIGWLFFRYLCGAEVAPPGDLPQQ
jgi:hypothetical protein